jgi:hypothetical protein
MVWGNVGSLDETCLRSLMNHKRRSSVKCCGHLHCTPTQCNCKPVKVRVPCVCTGCLFPRYGGAGQMRPLLPRGSRPPLCDVNLRRRRNNDCFLHRNQLLNIICMDFTSERFTPSHTCLYQKDERALPRNLQSKNIFLLPPPVKRSVTHYSSSSFSSLSLLQVLSHTLNVIGRFRIQFWVRDQIF